MSSVTELREVAEKFYKAGQWGETLAVTASALESYPDDGALWETRGLALHACKEFVQARDAFEQATLLKPLSYFAQVGLASCYLATRQVDLAGVMYRHVASQPEVPTILLPAVAAGLRCVGDIKLAMEVHRERVRRDPDDDQAVFALAHYLIHFGEPPEKVLPLMRRAFALAPDQPVYRVGLALMLAQCGDIQSAYQLGIEAPIEELIAVCCPCRLRGLALLFRRAGDNARAVACEMRAVEKIPQGMRPNNRDEGQT